LYTAIKRVVVTGGTTGLLAGLAVITLSSLNFVIRRNIKTLLQEYIIKI
jgi:hypothetical protein